MFKIRSFIIRLEPLLFTIFTTILILLTASGLCMHGEALIGRFYNTYAPIRPYNLSTIVGEQ